MKPEQVRRIAVVCTGFPIPTETFVLNQVAGFLKAGIEVDIFPYTKWPSIPGVYEEYRLEGRVFETVIPPRVYTKRLWGALKLFWTYKRHWGRLIRTLNIPVLGKSAADLTVFYGAIPFLGKPSYNLIIAHFGENGIGMEKMIRCGFIKAPLITIFHGYDIHWNEGGFGKKQAAYRNLFRHGAAFVANGSYGIEKLKQLGAPPERCVIIPAGIDTANFIPVVPAATRSVHFSSIGRLMELKGHHLALAALARLHQQGCRDWTYTIAGTGDRLEELKRQAIAYGIDRQVHFPGTLSTVEVQNLLQQTTVFIHPSITDGYGRAETQGLAIQEAQASGLPVVAFHSGGIPDGVPPGTGILVPEGDVEALAGALASLINDTGKRIAMGKAARQWALKNYEVLNLNQRILALAGFD